MVKRTARLCGVHLWSTICNVLNKLKIGPGQECTYRDSAHHPPAKTCSSGGMHTLPLSRLERELPHHSNLVPDLSYQRCHSTPADLHVGAICSPYGTSIHSVLPNNILFIKEHKGLNTTRVVEWLYCATAFHPLAQRRAVSCSNDKKI